MQEANGLFVPIHLDALFLESAQTVLEAMADFSKLPYYDGEKGQNANADVPYISEEIVSHPFRDQSLRLNRGVHLHWALPDALTQGMNSAAGVVFPPAPDRWLVTRCGPDGVPQKQWMIESDYLHPEGKAPAGTVSFPLPPRPNEGKWQPYRYLGRKWVVGEGRPADAPGAEYLNALVDEVAEEEKTNWHRVVAAGLTALGYGEPAFAAFYPSCRSVFGLHDDEITSREAFQEVRYDVIGWYDQPERRDCLRHTPLQQTREAIAQRIHHEYEASGHDHETNSAPVEVWDEAVAHHFGWTVARQPNAEKQEAERIFCYARLTPDAGADFENDPALTSGPVDIAVGNSASEALSAYLAHRISGDKALIEEQLEGLDLGDRLEHRRLDIGPKFREARHGKGFKSLRAGILWNVRLERDTSLAAAPDPTTTHTGGRDVHAQTTGTLPVYLAHALNDLNVAQGVFQRSQEDMDSLRQQIYHDWTLYMQALRPPEGLASGYPDPVEIARFIEKTGLRALRRKLAATGNFKTEREAIGGQKGRDTPIIGATAPAHTADTALASRVAVCINDVIDGLKTTNDVLDALRRLDLVIAEAHKSGAGGIGSDGEHALEMLPVSLEAALRAFLDRRRIPFNKRDSLQALRNCIHRETAGFSAADQHKAFRDDLAGLLESLPPSRDSQPQVARMRYVLRQMDAPRYYQPTDPVVLLAASDLKPTERHGMDGKNSEDGKLVCKIISIADFAAVSQWTNSAPEPLATIRSTLLQEALDDDQIGARLWRMQPWHPFMLEWQVEMLPISAGSNREGDRQSYAASFVAQNYNLQETAVDLDLKPGASAGPRRADTGIYSGSCVLTDHASDLLLDKLDRYLQRVEESRDGQTEVLAETVETLRAVRDFLSARPNTLSQALDGFHEALLQRHQILQLPVADPIGFSDMKPLTEAVREATQGRHASSPLRDNDFTPIRSGRMKLRQLRLVDTFGRVKPVLGPDQQTPIITSELLRVADAPNDINLPPRLLQPARLNFRWLSADHAPGTAMNEPETNAHPAYTPVCGWILPNNLDGSLLVYDNTGEALGTILGVNGRTAWQPAPGSGLPHWEIERAESTMNPHLRKLVNTIVNDLGKRDAAFFDQFLATLTSALENIAPEDFSHHESLALLMGRPIAVVRALVNLELRGQPAVNQSLSAFLPDMMRGVDSQGDRTSDDFTHVRFPIRIGEDQQLNDGLVGYFLEEIDGEDYHYKDTIFFAPQAATPQPLSLATPSASVQSLADQLDMRVAPAEIGDHLERPWSAAVTIEESGQRWRIDTEGHVYTLVRGESAIELFEMLNSSSEQIQIHWKEPINLMQSLDDPPQKLTMLVDPQGSVHAVSGILPTKSITIPTDQYAAVLRKLEVTFLSTPILTEREKTRLPLAAEAGYEWAWLRRRGEAWIETDTIGRTDTRATFPGQQRIVEGWLKLRKAED